MILTASELRQYITTDETDLVLEAYLRGLELLIRAYTNNNFQIRAFRAVAVAVAEENKLLFNSPVPFKVGDTLQITESDFMQDELVTVSAVDDSSITVIGDLSDESGVVVTKVKYPTDVKLGIVNLVKWELEHRDKVGVASESISRHTVNYIDQTKANTIMGFPVSLMGFLKPYRKAQFGRGIKL